MKKTHTKYQGTARLEINENNKTSKQKRLAVTMGPNIIKIHVPNPGQLRRFPRQRKTPLVSEGGGYHVCFVGHEQIPPANQELWALKSNYNPPNNTNEVRSTRSAGSVDIRCRETCTCPIERVVLVGRHNRRTLQAPSHCFCHRDGAVCEPRPKLCRLGCSARIRRRGSVVPPADGRRVDGSGQLALAVLLQKLAAESGAFENRLNEMVLLEWLGQVLVHLCLDTLFAIAHHGMCGKCNNRSALGTEAAFILTNLGRSFESALVVQRVLASSCTGLRKRVDAPSLASEHPSK